MDALPPIVIARPADAQLLAAPIPKGWIIAGAPEARAAELARSSDGAAVTVVWETSAVVFRWRFDVDETVHVLEGEVYVTDEKSVERHLGPGDVAYFPAGAWSVWRVPDRLRKIAFVRHDMPFLISYFVRAWNWVEARIGFSRPPTVATEPNGQTLAIR